MAKPERPYTVKQGGTPKMFDNPLLERLSRTHISLPLIIFYGCGIGLIFYSILVTHLTGLQVAGFFWLGFVFFTFVEYMVHRYLFHITGDTHTKEKFQYNAHGVHHEYPKDKDRLAMPPLISVFVASGFVGLFQMIMGDVGFGFAAGFLSGYATYLSVHYIVHVYKAPKGFFKRWWTLHAIHHFTDETVAFGVSSPFWDYVFKTMPEHKKRRIEKEKLDRLRAETS